MLNNELERYLKAALDAHSRRDAVRALADRIPRSNRGRLCQRLHTLLETGEAAPDLIQAVRDALESDAAEFDAALEQTRAIRKAQRDSERLAQHVVDQVRLGVHLWVEHERRRPSQITIVAMTGLSHWKRIGLPQDLPDSDWAEQCEVVAYACRQWLEVRGPRCLLFGAVTGFVYRPRPWSSYRCSLEGHLCPEDLGSWGPTAAQWSVR